MVQLRIGLIGGSGLGAALTGAADGKRHVIETPFGKPSDAIIETEWAGVPVLLLNRHGPGHLLNPTQVPYRANVFALKQLGCTHVLASGAVGSLRDEFRPCQLVVPDQVIDRTTKRAGTFFDRSAVHVEFAEPFCPVLRQMLLEAAPAATASLPAGDGDPPFVVHGRGCYVAMEGPAFSTRAESLMHRLLGGDLIGMTAMPEAKLAREAELPYALVSLVTDYDCWKTSAAKPSEGPQPPADPHVLLKEITRHLQLATQRATALLQATVELMARESQRLAECPASRALQLGIWSDRDAIDRDEVRRLAPLWGRYLSASDEPVSP